MTFRLTSDAAFERYAAALATAADRQRRLDAAVDLRETASVLVELDDGDVTRPSPYLLPADAPDADRQRPAVLLPPGPPR